MTASGTTLSPARKLPPMLGGGLPVLGHTLDFVRDTIGLLERARRECGDVAKFRVVGKDMVLLTGPEVHEPFFRAPEEQLSPSEAYKMMVPVFGEGVAYDAEPRRMFEQLHMLVPALRDQRMRTYGQIIQSEVEEQQKACRGRKAVEQGRPGIDCLVRGVLALQVVDGEEQPGQQAEDNASGVKMPGLGADCSGDQDRPDQAERDRDDLDGAELLFEDQAAEDGGHGR